MGIVLTVVGFLVGFSIVPLPTQAQTPPKYGMLPFTTGLVSSTADQDILAAPGTAFRWRVTSLSYNVLVEEADATVVIEDAAGTPVPICEFAPETQGASGYFDFEEGIACSQNSAVTVDFSGSTADCWIVVTAYKERVQDE